MKDDQIRRRVIVQGRVQGVFFRDSLRRHAQSRNEAVFEGRPDDVERVIEFARTGPRQAEVASVDVREEPPEGLTGFAIR